MMQTLWGTSLTLGMLVCIAPTQASQPHPSNNKKISIAVTEFVSKEDVDQAKMDALSEMLANHLRDMGPFRVIGKNDILAALKHEEQKEMLGCNDNSCLAEIGGALGVQYIVVGNINLLGKTWLLNLSLIDVQKVEVIKGVSRTISGSQDAFINVLPQAAFELMKALPNVTIHNPGLVPEYDGAKPRAESGWFVPPGGRGGDWQLALSLGLMVAPAAHLGEDTSSDTFGELQSLYTAGWLNLLFGYNLTNWLTLGLRAGGSVGETKSGRDRNVFEGAIRLQGSMMTDSWFQPIAYFDFGILIMRDTDPSAGDNDFSQRIETAGIVTNLGVGFQAFVTPRWFLGFTVGGTVRSHTSLFRREPMENDPSRSRMVGYPDATAFEIAVTFAAVGGYEF